LQLFYLGHRICSREAKEHKLSVFKKSLRKLSFEPRFFEFLLLDFLLDVLNHEIEAVGSCVAVRIIH